MMLTVSQAADALNVSTSAIRTWLRRAKDPIPHFRVDRCIRINSEHLDMWIQRQTKKGRL